MTKAGIFFLIVLGPLIYFGLYRDGFQISSDPMKIGMEEDFLTHKALWLWRTPTRLTDEEMKGIISNAKVEGFSDIYLDFSEFADITDQKDKQKAKEELEVFTERVGKFVSEAVKNSVRVHALAGNETWSDPLYTYLPKRLLEFVIAFNNSALRGERLSGIQFDIEFYGRDNLEDGSKLIVKKEVENFLRLSEDLLKILNRSENDLEFGLAVPYWFDGSNDRIPRLEWRGEKKSASEHLFDLLSDSKKGYLALMNYRNSSGGEKGSILLAREEFEYAEKLKNSPKIVIGQLADKTKNKGTSFFEKNKKELLKEMSRLETIYGKSPAWGGFAVHSYDSYTALKAD